MVNGIVSMTGSANIADRVCPEPAPTEPIACAARKSCLLATFAGRKHRVRTSSDGGFEAWIVVSVARTSAA
jgi:hypothetical protein